MITSFGIGPKRVRRRRNLAPDGAPSALTLTVDSATAMTLNWTNGSTNQDGTRAYISTDGVNFTEKGTVTGSTATYQATGLTEATIYYFYVVAYIGTTESTASNTVIGVTEATALRGANAIVWYDYEKSTFTKAGYNGNWVSQFNDVLASGKDLKQATENLQPVWSRQGVFFDLKYMTTDAFTLNQPVFAYLVLYKTRTAPYNEGLIDGLSVTTGAIYRYNYLNQYIAAAGSNLTAVGQSVSFEDVHILKAYFNGANSKFRIDENTVITGNGGSNNMGGINIGRLGGVTSGSTNMMLKEVVLMSNADDETSITNYLKYKHQTSKTYKKILIIGDSFSDYYYTYWVNEFDRLWDKGGTPLIMNIASNGYHVFDDFAPSVALATTYNPEIIIVMLGTNDNDIEDFAALYQASLEQLKTDHPTAAIYCVDLFNSTSIPHGTRAYKNAQIAIAVGNVEGVTLWNTDGWIDPVTDTDDGYHPNAAGGLKVANEILSRL